MAKNPNIDDDTRERARKFVEEKAEKPEKEYRSDPYGKMTKVERDSRKDYSDEFPPPAVVSTAFDEATKRVAKDKPRVVSKKELEASGLSLRDFLNKERGLTRREDKPDSKVEAAKKQLKLGEKVSSEEVAKAKKQLNFNKGGMANCGASVPPAQKAKK
mgnify:CR=1 FL=1|jgi:hypothetical protein|tara:strand:+ start:1766 stop:2242 length:477 start_codon:yes stop_codon:yes gene_type:complete